MGSSIPGRHICAGVAVVLLCITTRVTAVAAQDSTARVPDVVCASKPGERQSCAANTGAGVTLLRETGSLACVLGVTWGYDQQSIWVTDGCSAQFALGKAKRDSWGTFTPGTGFKVVNTDKGDLNFSLYTYVRYLNQKGLDPTYTDAYGNTVPVQQRQDVQFQKVILYFRGWILSPRFRYLTYVWSTNTSQGSVRAGRRRRQPHVQHQQPPHRRRRDLRPARRALDRGSMARLAPGGQPPHRRRVLPALLHHRHLGPRRGGRSSQLHRHAGEQPQSTGRGRRPAGQRTQHRSRRPSSGCRPPANSGGREAPSATSKITRSSRRDLRHTTPTAWRTARASPTRTTSRTCRFVCRTAGSSSRQISSARGSRSRMHATR